MKRLLLVLAVAGCSSPTAPCAEPYAIVDPVRPSEKIPEPMRLTPFPDACGYGCIHFDTLQD